jgi:hypothetical protein
MFPSPRLLMGGRPRAVLTLRDPLALVQWLALVTMLVDHLGSVGYLGEWSRLVGRFALPAFVLMVVLNARAADPGLLLSRYLVLIVLSQPAWWWVTGSWDTLCILFTLCAMALAVSRWRSSPVESLLCVLLGLGLSPWVEYGPWPWLLVPLLLAPSLVTLALALVWPFFQYPDALGLSVFVLVCLLLLLLLVRVPFNVPRLPRYATRFFYPLHLFLIGLTKTII